MDRNTSLVVVLAVFSLALPVAAQDVTNLPEGTRHSVTVDLGLQSAVVSRATYAWHAGGNSLYGRFTLPFGSADVRDVGFEAGGQVTALASDDWKLQIALAPLVRLTSNDVFSSTAIGGRVALLPGYQGDRWGLRLELAYEKMLATHVTNSSLYRSIGYAGAKDGWYSLTGGTLQAGLRGGYRFGHVEVSAGAGLAASEGLNQVAPPFYGTLGTTYAF